MKTNRKQFAEIAAIAAIVIAVIGMVAVSGGETKPDPGKIETVLVCIDSTESTDDVRDKYEVDIEKVVRQTAFHQDHFLAAACGANAIGEVDWPVSKWFRANRSSERFAKQELESQADEVMQGTDEKQGIVDLLEVESKETTPMGEMLAVTAQQCDGEGCQIYYFTDGEWADHLLRVKEGVSDREREAYIETYGQRLGGLDGSTVHFIGVGLKTNIGAVALDEAKEVAAELLEEAGAEMGRWKARL